jgi:trigger factor
LDYQIQRGDDWHNTISVTIPAEEVKPALDERYASLKNIRLEGFRKGKVPPHLVKKMYGKQVESEAFNPFISQAYQQIFKENEFDFLSAPEVRNIRFDDQSGLGFEFHFDIRPVIEVTGFRGMPVERTVFEVNDEDVEKTLQRLQQQNAMVYNVDGEAQTGHYVICDLQELDRTGVPVLGRKLDDRVIELKEGDEITAQLLGVKAGEERRVQVTNEKPAAQTLEVQQDDHILYSITVKEIKERRLPQLDDEFAKDLGPYETMAAVRKDIWDRLQMQAQSDSMSHFRQALEDELIKRNPMEVPPSMLDKYLEAVVEDTRKRSKTKVDDEQLRSIFRPMAIRSVKWILLREQLIKDFQFAITDEELETRLSAIAATGEPGEKRVEELRNNEELMRRFKDGMEEEKVYDLLNREAVVQEVHESWSKHQHGQGSETEEQSEE